MIRVLLVEDDLDLLASLALALEVRFEVRLATDGADALNLIESGERFDVLVVDLMMPRVHGSDLISTLRAGGHAVPVILISAHSSVAEKASEAGIEEYLIKPFSVSELSARIERVVRGGGSSGPDAGPGKKPDRSGGDSGSLMKWLSPTFSPSAAYR